MISGISDVRSKEVELRRNSGQQLRSLWRKSIECLIEYNSIVCDDQKSPKTKTTDIDKY